MVEYKDMVDYVDNHTGRVLKAVEAISVQLANHEIWHRKNLESQITQGRNDGWQRKGIFLSMLSSAISAVGIIVLITQHAGR